MAQDYACVINAVGAAFLGVQRGPGGFLILFSDPQFNTTLAVREIDFSPETVSRRLAQSRTEFQAAE
jgi:hypothetical protein